MGQRRNGKRLHTAAAEDDGPPIAQKTRRRRNNNRKGTPGLRNGLYFGTLALVIAVLVGGPLGNNLQDVGLGLATLVLLASIGVAILTDILAIAATAGKEEPFHAMASNKVAGAKEALLIVRNAEKVNSIFSDVIGDICGTISGVVSAPIILSIHSMYPQVPISVITMAVLGLVAFLTIGGKAAEKGFAVKASTSVLLFVGKLIHYITRLRLLPRKQKPRSRNNSRNRQGPGQPRGKAGPGG